MYRPDAYSADKRLLRFSGLWQPRFLPLFAAGQPATLFGFPVAIFEDMDDWALTSSRSSSAT
jgi:hypothetical protein